MVGLSYSNAELIIILNVKYAISGEGSNIPLDSTSSSNLLSIQLSKYHRSRFIQWDHFLIEEYPHQWGCPNPLRQESSLLFTWFRRILVWHYYTIACGRIGETDEEIQQIHSLSWKSERIHLTNGIFEKYQSYIIIQKKLNFQLS